MTKESTSRPTTKQRNRAAEAVLKELGAAAVLGNPGTVPALNAMAAARPLDAGGNEDKIARQLRHLAAAIAACSSASIARVSLHDDGHCWGPLTPGGPSVLHKGCTDPDDAPIGTPDGRSVLELLAEALRTTRGGNSLSALTVVVGACGLATPYRPAKSASLPRLHRTSGDDSRHLESSRLPAWLDSKSITDPQQFLPGMEPDVAGCPNWLLALYDSAGGESLAQGRGAPWDLRLFVGAMLHLGIVERDGEWHRLPMPLADVVAWLHPDGWGNRRRDWDKLPVALRSMSRLYVPVPGIGSVLLCVASVIPDRPDHPGVEFTVRVPRSAAAGARIDWPRLCQYGKDSAALYRAYLSVCSVLDNSARHGQPLTRQIAAPVIGLDGKRKRRKGGVIVRDPGTMIDNPAARFVKRLTDADAARFVGFDPASKQRRHDARRALERLADDGVIEIEHTGRGRFRIFAPNPEMP